MDQPNTSDREQIVAVVQRWISSIVIDFNLCPFAKPVFARGRIRFSVSEAQTEEHLVADLEKELEFLSENESIETALLIHPYVLQDFFEYNQFLDVAEALLKDLEVEGVFQVASFHPDYRFSGTEVDDVENFTNRSPYPMLHVLREDSISEAVLHYTDPENIPVRNIARLKKVGWTKMHALWLACFDEK